MATNAEKFVIELAAKYSGREEITRLQGELDKLHQVENLQKWRKTFQENVEAMGKAREEAARLAVALESSYDEKVLARLQKAEAELGKLRSAYARQEEAVARTQAAADQARLALERYSSTLSATPSDKEAARQAALAAALQRAEDAYAKQRETLARTGEAMARAGRRVDELKEALRNSVDPEIQRRHEEQIRLQERHAQTAATLRERIEQTATALRAQGVSTQNLAAEQQRLNTATEASGRHLAAMRTLGIQSFSSIEERVRQLRQAWDDLDKSNMSMRERFAHWTQYQQRLSEAREQTNGWTASVQRLQQGWAGVLGVLGGLSIMGRAAQEFAGFETGMLKVQALTNATGADFEALNAKAKELGATTRYSAREAADGMYQLAAAGMDVDQIMNTIPSALHMAAAAEMDVGEAADKVTNIMSQFGMKGEEAARKVADVMTAGFTGAATSMQQLSDAMVYCGPVANALGYSLEETTAILQALANAGYKGEQAGTALRGGFTRLIRPMKMGREVLEQYNIQITDASGVMRPFADILEDIGKAGMSTAEMIRIFGQEAGPGMIALLSQGADAIRDYEKALEDVDGKAAALAEHVESGLEGAWRRLQAGIAAIAISFGETFGPALTTAVDLLAAFASRIAELPGPVKVVIGVLTGAAAAFAMWKLGLNTMCLALRQFVLDIGAASAAAYRYATVTLPAYVAEMRLAGATTSAFSLALNKMAADLPLVGKLLAANTRDLLLFRGAATRAGAALRLVGAAGMALMAWEVGKMVGNWLSQFALVRKAAVSLAHGLNLAALYAQKMWAWLTGGNSAAVAREIEAAKEAYRSMLDEIDKESAKTASAAAEKRNAGDEPEEKRERKSAREKLDELNLDEDLDDESDEDADDEEEEDDDPFAEPEKKKEKKEKKKSGGRTRADSGKAKEPEEKPYWQQLYDEAEAREKAAEEAKRKADEALGEERRKANEEADAERAGKRVRVWNEDTGKWREEYGLTDADLRERYEERDGRLYEKPRETPTLAEKWVKSVADGMDKLGLNSEEFKAAYETGAAKIAEAAESLNEAARRQEASRAETRPDEDSRRPDKVVELKLGNARLSGGERDVEDFLRQLEQAGMTA